MVTYDPIVFVAGGRAGIVAVEWDDDRPVEPVLLYIREGATVRVERRAFQPFLLASLESIAECPIEYTAGKLAGNRPLNLRARFASWESLRRAADWLAKATGRTASAAAASCSLAAATYSSQRAATGCAPASGSTSPLAPNTSRRRAGDGRA